MALFTDPNVITLDDLLLFESTLVQVSSTHGIDVQTKINLAIDGIGDQLSLALLRAGYFDWQTVPQIASALSHVLVSPAIYRWLCFDTLSRVFAEAFNVQLNTRFEGKMKEYQAQALNAKQLVYASALGIVAGPLARPISPIITVGAGSYGAAAIFVQTAWVDQYGQESALSAVNGSVLNGFASVQIDVTKANLQPAPASAVGWNVYISESQQGLTRQNAQAIALGQSWTIPGTGLITGASWSGGQLPNRLISLSTRVQRG